MVKMSLGIDAMIKLRRSLLEVVMWHLLKIKTLKTFNKVEKSESQASGGLIDLDLTTVNEPNTVDVEKPDIVQGEPQDEVSIKL